MHVLPPMPHLNCTRNACAASDASPELQATALGLVNGFGAAGAVLQAYPSPDTILIDEGSVLQGSIASYVSQTLGWNEFFLMLCYFCVVATAILPFGVHKDTSNRSKKGC